MKRCKVRCRTKLTSDDELLIRQGYIKGIFGKRVARQIGVWEDTVYHHFNAIRLTKEELAEMYANLRALHNKYDKLRSFKLPKERRLNALATILCRRIDCQEKKMFVNP